MDIIVLKPGAGKSQIRHIEKRLKAWGLTTNIVIKGTERTIIGVKGDTSRATQEQEDAIRVMEGVEEVMRIIKPFKLASRDFQKANTVINVRGKRIGGKRVVIFAGPCAVEDRAMLTDVARKVKSAGASFLRGGGLQAPHVPVFLSGAGGRGPEIPPGGKRANRAPRDNRAYGPQGHGSHSQVRGHHPDRCTEHAELQAAP
jgi:3-deoxy-7-phosphoheptulonate synthase